MAYIIKRIKEHKKNASGGYDIVHRETEASLTLLNDASTAQEHANSFIASESGVHGFKYDIVEGILEAFNEQTEEWEPITSGGAPDIQIPAVPTQSGSLVYNGSVQYPTWENFDSNQLAISGVINAVDAGMYEAIFTPKPGFVWFDGTKSVKSVVWAIGKASIGSTPTQSGTLTYNGSIQSPIWQNYNPAQLVIGGDLSGVDVGSYAVMFVPNANHQWWDGNVDGKYVSWNINKVAGSSSINPTSLTLNTSNPSGTITVTRQGDGAISAVSSNTSVATVTVSGNVITVNSVGKNNGSATITVKVAAGTNHTAPSDKTCGVTASFLPEKKSLNNTTWAEIREISDAGQGANYWAVGDAKQITINGRIGKVTGVNLTTWAAIIGFNHNSSREGSNRIHFQIGRTAQVYSATNAVALIDNTYDSVSDVTGSFAMNPAYSAGTSSNFNGWRSCGMRTVVLGSESNPNTPTANTFLAALPSDLRVVMKSCTKYTDNTGGENSTAGNVNGTTDYVFLLSEYEVFGIRSYANPAEQNYQQQYAYYSAGNSKVRYRHSATGSTAYWWLRSPQFGASDAFCIVRTSGTLLYDSAGYCLGVSPGFCV